MMKAFISYSTKDKRIAGEVKDQLEEFSVSCFMAHEDIGVSEQWKARIITELKQADIFVALLSENFKASDWAPQEIGFIASRPKLLLIPLSLDGTIPFGFINHVQAKSISEHNYPLEHIIKPIVDRWPKEMISHVINVLKDCGGFRYAESVMALVMAHLEQFSQEQIDLYVECSLNNYQVWDAQKCCEEFLPRFIKIHGKRVKPKKLVALKYQITKRKWHKSIRRSK